MMSFRLFATAAVAALCLAAAPTLAQAQDKPAKPAATTKPKQPAKPAQAKPAAAPATAPAAADDAPPVLEGASAPPLSGAQPDWVKVCQTDPQVKKEVCLTNRALRSETGQTVMTTVVINVPADKKQTLRLVMPTGVLLPNGVSLFLDNTPFMSGKFLACFPDACLLQLELDDAGVALMRKAKIMQIAVKTPNQNLALPLSMDGFGKAYDGAPIDPKQIAQEQQKLQEQLQKAAEKARNDLNAAPAPAPAQ
jgi:invasion protein IalB